MEFDHLAIYSRKAKKYTTIDLAIVLDGFEYEKIVSIWLNHALEKGVPVYFVSALEGQRIEYREE